jgi:GNAT superfamily N-acetyltransferase
MVSFREVSVADPAAHSLIAEYFDARAVDFPEAMGKYKPTFPDPAVFEPPSGEFIVVEDVDLAGEPADVGCGGIRVIPSSDTGLARVELKHIYLQPHLRGRGFGRLLLVELERRAQALGAQEVVLDTNQSLIAAGGLYRSSGYDPIAAYNDNPNATHWYGKVVQ